MTAFGQERTFVALGNLLLNVWNGVVGTSLEKLGSAGVKGQLRRVSLFWRVQAHASVVSYLHHGYGPPWCYYAAFTRTENGTTMVFNNACAETWKHTLETSTW